MNMSPEDFLAIMGERNQGKDPPAFCLGTIPAGYTSGRPQIQFDGESTVSSRTYPYLSSYTPVASDRVLVANVSHGAVILGKVV